MTRPLLTLLSALSLLASGCSGGRSKTPQALAPPEPPPALEAVAPATTDLPAQPTSAPADAWVYWLVDEGDAETVLMAVVRSGSGTREYEVPLKRYHPNEPPEDLNLIGLDDSVTVADDPGPAVTVQAPSVRGGLLEFLFNLCGSRRRLTVPVDRPSEHRLSEDATLFVSFREPKRVPHAEPEWERELAREREDPATGPLPPPWGGD